MSKYILSIDQGTTGTTVSLIDSEAKTLFKVNQEFEQIFPQPGWVEHNPDSIWQTVVSCIGNAISGSQINPNEIAGIGITNQRETVLVWEKSTGKAIYNAIVWQCRRTAPFCEKLKKRGLANTIKRKTGLVIDPYFSGSKIRWILDHVSGAKAKARKGELLAGTIDSYLLWQLTKGRVHKTDVSNASRTQLMNIKTLKWDKELLKVFGVPEVMLPEIVPSAGDLGRTRGVPGLPDAIPVSGVAGDQQAALFGQICFKAGEAKCTFGTGSFILMNVGNKPIYSRSGLLTTVGWQYKNKVVYALEGGAFICGAAVQWLRDQLGFIEKSSDIEALAQQVEDSEGVEFVPALTGLGAPYWDAEARGTLTGLTRGSHRSHIARATIDAMALQNVDILVAMEKDLKKKLVHLKVDGGAAANNLLMQLQANYLGCKIYRPEIIEATVAGAAYLAGLGVGLWSSQQEIKKIWRIDQEFKAELSQAKRKQRLDHWHKAIGKSMF